MACTEPVRRGDPLPSDRPLTLKSGSILMVIGMRPAESQLSTSDRDGLRDRRIGFGLNKFLAESLYDTGQFRMVEEKALQQRELIEQLLSAYWMEPRAEYTQPELRQLGKQLSAALLAYANIAYRPSRERMDAGPISRAVQKLRVQVTICLYDVVSDAILCREGEGEARQERAGIIYEPREDRLDFEKNAAGIATRLAVVRAVQQLAAGVTFTP